MIIKVIIVAGLGLAISAYAYFVEQKIKGEQSYKPSCDISDHFSCSKPLMSKYGKLFGFSNSVLGMLFYSAVILCMLLGFTKLIFWSTLIACATSLLLAYILFFKLHVFCIVCVSIYVINILLLWVSWQFK